MLYQLAFLAFINGVMNFIGSPKNKTLDIIWGGIRIIIKIVILLAAIGVFYFDIWNILRYTFFAFDQNWWK